VVEGLGSSVDREGGNTEVVKFVEVGAHVTPSELDAQDLYQYVVMWARFDITVENAPAPSAPRFSFVVQVAGFVPPFDVPQYIRTTGLSVPVWITLPLRVAVFVPMLEAPLALFTIGNFPL
jgi:hypothetical protein